MLPLGTALEEIRALVEACGITTVLDPADLGELPGAWLEPSTDDSAPIAFEYLGEEPYTLNCTLYLLVADTGMVESYNALSGLLEKVRLPLAVQSAKFASVALQNLSGGSGLPALVITLSHYVTPED